MNARMLVMIWLPIFTLAAQSENSTGENRDFSGITAEIQDLHRRIRYLLLDLHQGAGDNSLKIGLETGLENRIDNPVKSVVSDQAEIILENSNLRRIRFRLEKSPLNPRGEKNQKRIITNDHPDSAEMSHLTITTTDENGDDLSFELGHLATPEARGKLLLLYRDYLLKVHTRFQGEKLSRRDEKKRRMNRMMGR